MTLASHSDSLNLHCCLEDVELMVDLLAQMVHLELTLRGKNGGYRRGARAASLSLYRH